MNQKCFPKLLLNKCYSTANNYKNKSAMLNIISLPQIQFDSTLASTQRNIGRITVDTISNALPGTANSWKRKHRRAYIQTLPLPTSQTVKMSTKVAAYSRPKALT